MKSALITEEQLQMEKWRKSILRRWKRDNPAPEYIDEYMEWLKRLEEIKFLLRP